MPRTRHGTGTQALACLICLGYIRHPFGQAMPKMKSHSGAKKRFRFTSTGKVKSKHSHKNHILTKKKSSRIRKLKGTHVVSKPDQIRIHTMLPNGRP